MDPLGNYNKTTTCLFRSDKSSLFHFSLMEWKNRIKTETCLHPRFSTHLSQTRDCKSFAEFCEYKSVYALRCLIEANDKHWHDVIGEIIHPLCLLFLRHFPLPVVERCMHCSRCCCPRSHKIIKMLTKHTRTFYDSSDKKKLFF